MTLSHFSPTRGGFVPAAAKTLAELAEMLKGYIRRSGKTQRQVAEDAGVPNPSYLSHMANGRINWVESDYFRPLTIALGLSVEEITDLNPDLIVTEAAASTRGAPRPRTRPLPPALQRMIETKSHLDPALQQERWQQYLAGQRFASGEITPERYWNLFLILKNAGVEPGGN